MKETVIEILKVYGGEMDITDFDIKYQGALITDVVLTAEEEIQFWSGSPRFSHSAEILIDEYTADTICFMVIDSFYSF